MDLLATLKARIKDTDLAEYYDNEIMLNLALTHAENAINLRRGYTPISDTEPTIEPRYIINKLEGAIDYLSKIGAEGMKSISENGVSVTYKDVPDWLLSVIPKMF